MATPVAVPLVSSSNFDCSQVRVPSAKVAGTLLRIRKMKKKEENFRRFCKFKPLGIIVGYQREEKLQVITRAATGTAFAQGRLGAPHCVACVVS